MKTVRSILMCAILVFPLSIFAQVTSPNGIACHAGFKADITYTCNSSLEVHFTDQSMVPGGHTVSRWTWIFGDGTISNDWQPAHVYKKAGVYTVKLIIETDLGWKDSTERIKYITVAGKLDLELGNDTTIAPGTILGLNAGNPDATYKWNTGATTQTISVNKAGEYSVVVKKGNCETVDKIKVSVNAGDNNFSPKFSADATETCSSFLRVNFTDESTLPEGDFVSRWIWTFGDGSGSNDWKPSHDYTKPGVYNVKLIIETDRGLKDSVEYVNFITITGEVFVDLGNDTAIDAGTSIELNAANPEATYNWNTGANTQKIMVSAAGEYWVHVKKGNCEARDRINISIKQILVPKADFVADTTSTCSSFLRVNFKDETVLPPGDFISRWTWFFGDGDSSNDWRPSHDYTKPGLFTVTLIIQTDKGWSDTVERVNYISIDGGVFVDLGKDTIICEGTTLELNAGNSGATYNWNTGANTQKIMVSEPGEYWVHIKKQTCESRDRIVIGVQPPIFPQFGYGLDASCLPVRARFTDSSTACSGGIVRRSWDFGDGTTSTEENPEHIYNTADTFVVRLTIWDENGFSISRSKRVVVEGAQGPIVNLGNDTTVCEYQFLVLDAGNPDASFTWSTGDIFQSCVITNSDKVWVRVELNGCVASDTINVTVTPALHPKFGYTVEQVSCPTNVRFTDSSDACEVEIVAWDWDFGDGATSSERHPQHAYTVSGEYIVQLTIWDSYGYSSTRSKRVSVQVAPPTVSIGPDRAICLGELVMLDAGNEEGAAFLWSTGETTQQIFVQDDGDYWVRVSKGECMAFDTVTIRFIFPISPAFEYNVMGDCLPVEVKFTDKSTVTCDQQIVQWRWDFGDGTTSQEQNPTHTYLTSDSFAVRLTVITNTGLSVSKSRKIFVSNNAPIINAGQDLTICKGDIVQLDAGIDNAIYNWSSSSTLDNSKIRRPLASPTQTTTYTVSVTQCGATVTDQVVVFVNAGEQPRVSQDGAKLVSSNARSYQWYKNGELIAGANDKFLKPQGAGQYSVRIRGEGKGCQVESQKFFYMPDSKNENWVKGIRVKVTPNPSHGVVYVLLSHLPAKPVAVTVIDRYGQRLFTTTISNYSNMLNLSRLAKGYYTLEMILDREKVSIPVLIQ